MLSVNLLRFDYNLWCTGSNIEHIIAQVGAPNTEASHTLKFCNPQNIVICALPFFCVCVFKFLCWKLFPSVFLEIVDCSF